MDWIHKLLGRDRQIVTSIDEFRASQFVQAILSGSNTYGTSGQQLVTVAASNVVRGRILNIHMQNRETAHVTVQFRDGNISGGIIAGPFIINPISERPVKQEELLGRIFTSGINASVISGTYSAGVSVDIGYILEPDPTAAGGYVE